MTSKSYTIDLEKDAKRSINRETLQKQIDYVKERVVAAGREKRGWSVSNDRIDHRYNMATYGDNSGVYHTTLTMECKPKVVRQTYDSEFSNIVEIVRAAIKTHRWEVKKVNGEEPKVDIRTADDFFDLASTYIQVDIPEDWKSSFDHLYERDAHIEIIHDAIEVAIDSNWKHRFHVLLYGPPGCLAEGTSISYKRGKRNSGRSITIENLYAKMHNLYLSGKGNARLWDSSLPTYIQSWNDEDGSVLYNKILRVVKSGPKECFRITTTCGVLEATFDHPVLDTDGSFKPIEEFKIGDELLVLGSMLPVTRDSKRVYKKRVIVEGLRYHPFAWRKVIIDGNNRYEYQRITRARLVIEASFNKLDYSEFVDILKNDEFHANKLRYISNEYDVHHIDENPMNDDINNLCIIAHDKHPLEHDISKNFNIEYTKTAIILDIENIGIKETFDIQMTSPYHNFVVNEGIIVHNCGKSDITLSIKDMVGPESVLEFDATATTSAGAIRDLNERDELPRILLVEEIEKADENSLRWLLGLLDIRGNIRKLTYRGRTQRDTKMLCVATVNDVDLFRKMMFGALASRFSHQLYCPRPDRALLGKILQREVREINGNESWINPTLDYLDRHSITDPRKAMAVCLTGRDRLITGEFQAQMDKTMEGLPTANLQLVKRLAGG